MEFLGNATEETVQQFLNYLDKTFKIGPAPLEGYGFDVLKIEEKIGCSKELVLSLMEQPSKFYFDELDQVYIVNEEGDTIYLDSDDTSSHFEANCSAVVDTIPEVPFDLDYIGTTSGQVETANLFKCCVMSSIFEGAYDKEIKEILNGYDFNRMKDSNNDYSFTKLAKRIQEEANPVEKVILMCLTTKCVSSKFKKSSSYADYLDEALSEKLNLILRKEAALNYSFDVKFNKANSPGVKYSLGEELKAERLKILSQFSDDKLLMLAYKVQTLNANCVPGRKVRQIRNKAESFITDLTERGITFETESLDLFKKKLVKRAVRLYLLRMKQIRFKILATGDASKYENDMFIPKY